jgi:hypothetical protein
MGVDSLVAQIFSSSDWEIGFSQRNLILFAPSKCEALNLASLEPEKLAAWAERLEKSATIVKYPGGQGYRIPAQMAEETKMATNFDLLGADYIRIHEFLIEQRQSGNIVIITSNITRDASGNPISTPNPEAGRDICHHTSDLLLPSRAHWSARQFTGYNYRLSWRASFNDYETLNPQYDRLKEILARDGHAPNYEYTLYRPDGALCSYSTSYFLCRDYCGDEVRIGVSRPQDWQLLEPAPA